REQRDFVEVEHDRKISRWQANAPSLLQDQLVPPRDPQHVALAIVLDADLTFAGEEFLRGHNLVCLRVAVGQPCSWRIEIGWFTHRYVPHARNAVWFKSR